MNQYIDHTLLKQDARIEQILVLCKEAVEYQFKSVCINPAFVKRAADALKGSGVDVCTVVGFPLGASTSATKVFETRNALENGATEIDMVINVSDLKDGRYDVILEEITAIKEVVGNLVLKVILETCLLSKEEIVKACELSVQAGADFVKTSTGFSTGGATVEDVTLMVETVAGKAFVKASGGIRSREDFDAMVQAGATRIGASAGIAIMQGNVSQEDY